MDFRNAGRSTGNTARWSMETRRYDTGSNRLALDGVMGDHSLDRGPGSQGCRSGGRVVTGQDFHVFLSPSVACL